MQKKRIMIVSVICILLLTLCACGTKKQEKKADTVDFSSLSKTGSMELNYATQYSVDEYDGYKMITIVDDGRFLLIPGHGGAAEYPGGCYGFTAAAG